MLYTYSITLFFQLLFCLGTAIAHRLPLVKKRILLAEDNEEMAKVMCHRLEFLGYEVQVARDGQKAVELASSRPPDLIIMDILMPKMDGFQATVRIRQNPVTKAIPILAATVLCAQEDREECFASGCDGYLAKPFTHKDLQAAIEKLLNRSAHLRSRLDLRARPN